MKRRLVVVLVVLVTLALFLGGCGRSASEGVENMPPLDDNAAMEQAAQENPTVAPTQEETPMLTAQPTEIPTLEPTPEVTPLPTEQPTQVVATPLPTQAPVTESTPVVVATPVATPGTHVVQVGENLFRIALRYGVTVESIAQLNGITNPALIYVGQSLRIPGGSAQPTPAPQPGGGQVYTVQPGDNLFRIALRYNMSYIYLAQYNGISSPYWVYSGQQIRIP